MRLTFSLRLIPVATSVLLVFPCFAHSGGTDANGGHYDRKTGKYHIHNSGKSGAPAKRPTAVNTPRSIQLSPNFTPQRDAFPFAREANYPARSPLEGISSALVTPDSPQSRSAENYGPTPTPGTNVAPIPTAPSVPESPPEKTIEWAGENPNAKKQERVPDGFYGQEIDSDPFAESESDQSITPKSTYHYNRSVDVYCSSRLKEYHWLSTCGALAGITPTVLKLSQAKDRHFAGCTLCRPEPKTRPKFLKGTASSSH